MHAPDDEVTIRRQLQQLFTTAIAAADSFKVLPAYLPAPPTSGRCIVIGAGKASAAMAAALEAAWPQVALEGIVVTRDGHAVPTRHIRILEAAHPVPDEAGLHATEQILAAVTGLTPEDTVIALISGGGSALLTLPVEGISLADKQAVNTALLASGAPIHAMNIVRKALSRIKGGHLAQAAAPAKVITLLISDVPGDDPAIIASGPTVPTRTTAADALRVLDQYQVQVPESVRHYLEDHQHDQPQDFPADIRMIASPMQALKACAAKAREFGWHPIILGDAIEGESAQLGTALATLAQSIAQQPTNQPSEDRQPAEQLPDSDTDRSRETLSEGQGFSPAVKAPQKEGALAPEGIPATLLQSVPPHQLAGLTGFLTQQGTGNRGTDLHHTGFHPQLCQPLQKPVLLLSGGETTVTLIPKTLTSPNYSSLTEANHPATDQTCSLKTDPGSLTPGRGGRNTEFLLSLAIALQGHASIYAIAGDTDGIDGSDDAAGAIITPSTLSRSTANHLNPQDFLRRHDSYTFFAALSDLVFTGPTLTNVNDLRAVLIL